MKECPDGGTTPAEQFFGNKLSSARMVIECTFGRLKGSFGVLRRPMDVKLSDLPMVIYSCFVLHNFCEMKKEPVSESRFNKVLTMTSKHNHQQQLIKKTAKVVQN